ncbi:hypothetical protein M5689_003787 [Euphorbia peplus]|nr:hypothetical protein M5689_003787 [Euphorbia peplus]
MANMVASPLLRVLSDRLTSLIRYSFDITNLQLSLAELQTLVIEAENRSEEEDGIGRWLTEVKDASYEADDVLDEFNRLSTFKFNTFLFPSQWLLRFDEP